MTRMHRIALPAWSWEQALGWLHSLHGPEHTHSHLQKDLHSVPPAQAADTPPRQGPPQPALTSAN